VAEQGICETISPLNITDAISIAVGVTGSSTIVSGVLTAEKCNTLPEDTSVKYL
jgi:hypothetical protein